MARVKDVEITSARMTSGDGMAESKKSGLLELIAANQDVGRFREMLWEGTYADYLNMVKEDPNICRNAYQRLYDLIESFEVAGHRYLPPSESRRT